MSTVAVVTGGAGAIGGAIARALAGEREIAVLDRDAARPVDLLNEAEVRQAARELIAKGAHCDVLVHAAAAFDRAALPDLDLELWRRVQAVNVESIVWLAQELVPAMRERGFGRIVLIVSDTVWQPPADDLLPYIASKAALVGVARSLARALGPGRDHGQLRRAGIDRHAGGAARNAAGGVRGGDQRSGAAAIAGPG